MTNDSIRVFTAEQAFARDGSGILFEYDAHLQESGAALAHGVVLQFRAAGRMGDLVPPEDHGLNALVVRLPDDFESALAELASVPCTVDSGAGKDGGALLVLHGRRSRVALQTDQCFALRDGIQPAGVVLCLWAGNTLVVRKLQARPAQHLDTDKALGSAHALPRPPLDVEVASYIDLLFDHLDAAAEANAVITSARIAPASE